ncbi:ATP-binding protein [Collimonas humicola]|uniref:ATP-binding protein n=1 Tax=Collimonas humicola TaxID=2825886 RepID=UPI001B8D3C0C|nr:ATP-binding protein [Collimonas humicola]
MTLLNFCRAGFEEFFMRKPILCIFFLAIFTSPETASTEADQGVRFSEKERQWIAANPILRVGIDRNSVLSERIQNGEYKGLASGYLAFISRVTGLSLQMVPYADSFTIQKEIEAGNIDLNPLVVKLGDDAPTNDAVAHTVSYYRTLTTAITLPAARHIYRWQDLAGKTIALKSDSAYTSFFREKDPSIRIVLVDNMRDALEAVADGRADATLGEGALSLDVMSFRTLSNEFAEKLSIAGRIDMGPLNVSMSVRRDAPILASIIDKALYSMTARENEQLAREWEAGIGFRHRTLSNLLVDYAVEIALCLLGFILTVIFACRERIARRRAIRSEQEKSMFLAVMSHEIRSPMNAIVASIELLQQSDTGKQFQKTLKVADAASETLLGLLSNILDFSKLEAKSLALTAVPCDIGSLVQETVDMMSAKIQTRRVPIHVMVDVPPDILIVVDTMRLRQVLLNLLSNASKFTEHGTIEVVATVHAASAGQDQGQDRGQDQGQLTVDVIDSGIGISKQNQKHLFRPFFQVDASISSRHVGFGLGLMICRELIALMAGRITLHSDQGKGTTVSFTIPCQCISREMAGGEASAKMLSDAAPVQQAVTMQALSPLILVVEDQWANQYTIERQLEVLGCTALIAGSGADALQILKEEQKNPSGGKQISLVLMDCYMQDMDGYATAKAIRDNIRNRAQYLPIIAVSAATDAVHRKKCLSSGMDDILEKPLRLDDLRRLLQVWLPDASLADGAGFFQPMQGEELYALFVHSICSDVGRMRQACADRDITLLQHLSHRIKGSAPMFDAWEAGELADSLESGLNVPDGIDWDIVRDAVDALADIVMQLDNKLTVDDG